MVVILTGTGPTLAGEYAETWTAEELAPLRGQGCRVLHHVVVDGRGDVDHVVLGPAGLLVLETKWSSRPWAMHGPEMRAAAAALEQRARRTWLQLKRHGAASALPVLVLWGRAGDALPDEAVVCGATTVLAGRRVRSWLEQLPPTALDVQARDRCVSVLSEIAGRADLRAEPVPVGVQQMVDRTLAATLLALASFAVPLALGDLHPAGTLLSAPLLGAGLVWVRRGGGYKARAVAVGAGAALSVLAVIGTWVLVA